MASSKLRLVATTARKKQEPAEARKKVLDRYEVLEGRKGANATIYRCLDIRTNREVALKEVPVSNGFKPVEMLEREFRAGKMLKHPNLLGYKESVEAEGKCYLVREWAKGKSVQEVLDSDRRLTDKEINTIITAVIAAVEYMHSFNPPYIHRDIKPANVIFDEEDGEIVSVKLIDLGAVTAVKSRGTTSSFGTHGFFALDAIANPSAKSDVFALGATLLYMKTKKDADEILDEENRYLVPSWIEGKHRKALEGTLHAAPGRRIDLATLKSIIGEQEIEKTTAIVKAEPQRLQTAVKSEPKTTISSEAQTKKGNAIVKYSKKIPFARYFRYLYARYCPVALMPRQIAESICNSYYSNSLPHDRRVALMRRRGLLANLSMPEQQIRDMYSEALTKLSSKLGYVFNAGLIEDARREYFAKLGIEHDHMAAGVWEVKIRLEDIIEVARRIAEECLAYVDFKGCEVAKEFFDRKLWMGLIHYSEMIEDVGSGPILSKLKRWKSLQELVEEVAKKEDESVIGIKVRIEEAVETYWRAYGRYFRKEQMEELKQDRRRAMVILMVSEMITDPYGIVWIAPKYESGEEVKMDPVVQRELTKRPMEMERIIYILEHRGIDDGEAQRNLTKQLREHAEQGHGSDKEIKKIEYLTDFVKSEQARWDLAMALASTGRPVLHLIRHGRITDPITQANMVERSLRKMSYSDEDLILMLNASPLKEGDRWYGLVLPGHLTGREVKEIIVNAIQDPNKAFGKMRLNDFTREAHDLLRKRVRNFPYVEYTDETLVAHANGVVAGEGITNFYGLYKKDPYLQEAVIKRGLEEQIKFQKADEQDKGS